jgi:NAD(P)-dependent dehydrogenase (short-subunit alcohol dehydrogenase family)
VEARGVRAAAIACDVSEEAEVKAMLERTREEFGRLDVLVNTVAWIDPPAAVVDMDYANWQRAMRTNVDSVFLCSKHAIPLMRESGGGLIVNISSINGTRGFPMRAPYGASKAAVINLTETLAMELLESDIRVNCLVPGAIAGERLRILRQQAATTRDAVSSTVRSGEKQGARPTVSVMEPIEVGRYVAFLASDDGARINGQALRLGDAPRSGAQVRF